MIRKVTISACKFDCHASESTERRPDADEAQNTHYILPTITIKLD